MTTDEAFETLERAVLRALIDRLKAAEQENDALDVRVTELEAQLERYETALRGIIGKPGDPMGPNVPPTRTELQAIARAALSIPPNQEDEPLQNVTEVAEPGAGPFKDVAEREAVEDSWL